MTTLTRGRSLGDIIKWLSHQGYNCISGVFRNASGGTLTNVQILGQPVKASSTKFVPVLATDESSAIGIVMTDQKVTLANNTDLGNKVLILRRGPALINSDALPAADVAGTSFTVATLVTAYAALSPPIIAQTEPDTVETQST